LTFRPEMLLSKPVFGDPSPSTALVVRARRLRNKRTGEEKVQAEILGIIPRTYSFNALMDFQYGPFEKIPPEQCSSFGKSDQFRVFYDKLLVREPTRSLDLHLNNDVPLCVPPILFTRLDQPLTYCFSSRFRTNEYIELDSHNHNHPYHRKERKSYAMFVNFNEPTPMTAHPAALEAISSLPPQSRKLAHEIEKLFRKRPAWTRSALLHGLRHLRIRDSSIKLILPAFGYYMPNGPWGRVWVRFGYDPRTEPTSRIYQTVDYRVRSPRLQSKLRLYGRRPRVADREDSDCSGSEVELHAEVGGDLGAVASTTGKDLHFVHPSSKSTSCFRFNRNSWPDARQILYQITDIDVPEVVEMLAAPVPRSKCDPVEGWMPEKHQKIIRESITRCLDTWLAMEEESSSRQKEFTIQETVVSQKEKTEKVEDNGLEENHGVDATPIPSESLSELSRPLWPAVKVHRCGTGRDAGIVTKNPGNWQHEVSTRVTEHDPLSVASVYISAAVNQHSGCLSVQKCYHTGIPPLLAYGSHCTLCFASADASSNGDLVVRRTVIGHQTPISAVAWIPPFHGPAWSTFSGHLLSASADGRLARTYCRFRRHCIIKLWFVDSFDEREVAALHLSSAASPTTVTSVVALHGCYLDEVESRLFIAAASRSEVFGWSLSLPADAEGGVVSSAGTPPTCFKPLNRDPALCLALRVVRLAVPASSTDPLILLLVGLSTGQLEVWALAGGQGACELTLAGSLKGHTDWLRCLDCIQIHQPVSKPTTEGDVPSTAASAAQFLVASGSQDRHIRVWHMQLTDKHEISSAEAKAKGMELSLPPAYKSCSLFARLECVLSGHDHWVTGVSWAPPPLTADSRPLLLSASMDKSLIVWEPSHPPLLTTVGTALKDPSTPDLWLEKQRYGTVGGNQLGFLDCAWGDSGWSVYGHGFQGNLSSWSFSTTGGGTVQCSLTGHAGPITDLSWSPTTLGKDSKIPLPADNYSMECPFYLLTASKDQSVRLHGLFRTDGSGCSPPVSTWRELARPQVHGYDMNALACLDALHYVSAGDEKVARVFSATAAFLQRFLPEEELVRQPSLRSSLPSGAVQAALGLSNRATEAFPADDEEDEIGTTNAIESTNGGPPDLGDPLYPPAEEGLAQSTLWAETRKLYGHSYEVFCLAAHPKGILVASACKSSKQESASIFLWRTSDWTIHQKLSYHQLTVTQLSFNPCSDDLLSVSRDRRWALWKAVPKSAENEIPEYCLAHNSPSGNGGHSRIIWTCAWNRDGRYDSAVLSPSASYGAYYGNNNTTVETRWCPLRDVIEVLRRGRRKHEDWFDDNDADISNLLAAKNELHKAYMDLRTDATKAAFIRCRRLVQQRLQEIQDTWIARNAEEIQGHMRIRDSGILCNADNTDTPCTPSAPAILATTATPTTLNDIPQPLPISRAHTAPSTSTHASAWSVTCKSIALRLMNHLFVTGSRDKHVMVWDPSTGARVESPHTMSNAVTALDLGPPLPAFNSAAGAPAQASILLAVGLECGSIHLLALGLSGGTKRTCSFTALTQLPSHWAHGGGAVKRLAFYRPCCIPVQGEQQARFASGGEDGLVRIFTIQLSRY
uniref:Elongator complex protein 2 n=1 Tax=Schistocephalus solidus TaxID=70667 RepID=A0A183SG65_SCHSO